MPLRFYTTLTRKKQEFAPVQSGRATIYSCGPTVYRDVHIGNLRAFLTADLLRRVLEDQGYEVKQVKNITDVGHMRQEMLERGEDKVIAAALAEHKTPKEITDFYTDAFHRDEEFLNIKAAHVYPRATEHIGHMLALAERLVERGFAYVVEGNVYFDVSRFPSYGRLSGNLPESLLEGVRAEADPLKHDARDFALWKAAEPGRLMKWPSPWGEGFPGWHIECSAMSIHHLGERFDLHTGGVDNIFPHHEDEIAQSEAALGHRVVGCWLHTQHLLVDGVKMAKSSGNTYTLADLRERGFEPLAFRYLCLTAHYRHRLNFTFPSLRAAAVGLRGLREAAFLLGCDGETGESGAMDEWRRRFWDAVEDDLALPRALGVTWQMLGSGLPSAARGRLLLEFDEVLGLDLARVAASGRAIPEPVRMLVDRRQERRLEGDFAAADTLRDEIKVMGYEVRDTRQRPQVVPAAHLPAGPTAVASSAEVPSLLDAPDACGFSVCVVARDDLAGLQRCLPAVLEASRGHDVEVIAVDNGSLDESPRWLDGLAAADSRLRVVHCDHYLGAAAGRNIALKQSRGRFVLLLDTSVEVTGDVFSSLAEVLGDGSVGVAGAWGVATHDLHSFEDARGPEVDAVEAYLMAFRRERVREVGLMDEKYRFYRHLDLDYSFAFRDRGYRNVLVSGLPLRRHEHSEWSRLPEEERQRLSKRNFYRFLRRWSGRQDLLVAHSHGS
jgi:cysteinyl-tRNA synthetase